MFLIPVYAGSKYDVFHEYTIKIIMDHSIWLTYNNHFNAEPCDPSPCVHGQCIPKNFTDFECDCDTGFDGIVCQNSKYCSGYLLM